MIILSDRERNDGPYIKLCNLLNTDIPILLLSRSENLNFNEQILSLAGKKYVIFDVIENGWDWNREDTLIVGKNEADFKEPCQNDQWIRLGDFIRKNPPALYFKRELLAKDATDTIIPCEYPNWHEAGYVETREQFNARPVSVFNYWGRSHEARLMLHGEIWKHAARKGYAVCDNVFQFNDFIEKETNENKWISLHMPWYSRIPITEILKINGAAKLSVSLPGAGVKCFRSTGESLVNSIVVLPYDNLAYSYELRHRYNCIRFPALDVTGLKNEWLVCETIDNVLQAGNLYDIYLEGLKAADFYRAENYAKFLSDKINGI